MFYSIFNGIINIFIYLIYIFKKKNIFIKKNKLNRDQKKNVIPYHNLEYTQVPKKECFLLPNEVKLLLFIYRLYLHIMQLSKT